MKPVLLFLLLLLGAFSSATAQARPGAFSPPQISPQAVDEIFRPFDNTRSPGCAVAVGHRGNTLLTRAYGMADLEHGAVNTPQTVFEPGSVTKQVTAAAAVLLALDGKISLEDDIRIYLPEVPDYGATITVRHLLNHTSGLRDWGSVAGIEGWPRTRRVHTHLHVLDIVSRQKALNYPPGEFYSYTNTGYNLLAILVERVSGKSLAEFTRERIFEPLGMTRTGWRDDFQRVVRGRAVAYGLRQGGEWVTLMPFENVYGNGGLLTTVEDLLRFTWNLDTGQVGGRRFLEEMHRQGVLNSGEVISYASGLQIGTYKGLPVVEHSGSTAGYRGHLARFPEQGLALAVLCNASTANAGGLLFQVADLYLGQALREQEPPPPPGVVVLRPEELQALAGTYRDLRTGAAVQISVREGGLWTQGRLFLPLGGGRFASAGGGGSLMFDRPGREGGRPSAVLSTPGQPGVRLEPVEPFPPGFTEWQAYVGIYLSDEAEATYRVVAEEGGLVLRDRWGQGTPLRPLYPDAFAGGGVTYVFRRDDMGNVVAMSWSESRVWDLRFRRVGEVR